jgi:hypothetical protein
MNTRLLAPLAALSALALVACSGDAAVDADTSDVTAKAKTVLLVSDIDDTIKRTDVLDKLAAAAHALDSHDPFSGMPALYGAWHAEAPSTRHLTYLSAAPGPLIELSKRFLRSSGFPGDTDDVADSVVSGRSIFESAGDFKTKKLEAMYDAMVAAHSVPDVFVLIGDNGEQDMIAYGHFIDYVASKGRSTKNIHSFIHHVYDAPDGSPIAAPHRAWVTAGDLAVDLRALGLLSADSLAQVENQVVSDLGTDASVVVPDFMSCAEFAAWPAFTGKTGAKAYATIEDEVSALCSGQDR